MIWCRINFRKRAKFLENIGRMTADMYIENLLQGHVLPFFSDIFLLMHDNGTPSCRQNNAHLNEVQIQRYCIAHHVARMEIPSSICATC